MTGHLGDGLSEGAHERDRVPCELLRVPPAAVEVTWVIDLPDGCAGVVITLLVSHGQRPLYILGRAVNRASGSYRGEGKTDARNALIIADQARVPRDLSPLRAADEAMAEPKLLTARRTDLVCDHTRASNCLRGLLTGIFPALERELHLAAMEPLILLTGYQTPGAIRRLGASRLQKWLRSRGARWSAVLACTAAGAAGRQHTLMHRPHRDHPIRAPFDQTSPLIGKRRLGYPAPEQLATGTSVIAERPSTG
ncbi:MULTISPECIES: IS110 family transposase [unclassified Streptomyces]|uniref:IS110 family transposase n=1 Tax=unclassified Streptomyces TaxID=2593676 RepID=UPI003D902258